MIEALLVSLKLSFLTTFLLLLFSLVVSPVLAFGSFRGKGFLLALFTVPLVLPPTVLGFYLILLLSPESLLGKFLAGLLGSTPLFTFWGILIASLIYSLPFAVLPVVSAMERVRKEYIETAFVFGYSKLETYFRVVVPSSLRGFSTAAVLVFAHTMGEFGVVLMVGGNIPGETQTLSIFVYDSVQALDYDTAHRASLLLVGVSLAATAAVLLRRNSSLP
ncbi:MAG: molybdate ABC transporter permease subunit [Aquificae bacterium]|nr:molybdate ABC transporter permease subunit [Aquificota bacterium]